MSGGETGERLYGLDFVDTAFEPEAPYIPVSIGWVAGRDAVSLMDLADAAQDRTPQDFPDELPRIEKSLETLEQRPTYELLLVHGPIEGDYYIKLPKSDEMTPANG